MEFTAYLIACIAAFVIFAGIVFAIHSQKQAGASPKRECPGIGRSGASISNVDAGELEGDYGVDGSLDLVD